MNRSILIAASMFAFTVPASAQTLLAALESDDIVVTATRTERSIEDVPESVSVISADTIAATPGNALDDVLRQSASVDLPGAASYQVHPTANSISMRGLGGIRALVLLDGLPINDPFFGYMQWSRVPLENVERVEVVRGAGAALWGNYAMGGVINVLTRQPEETEAVIDASAGSHGTYRASAYGSYVASDRVRLSVQASRYHTDGFMQIEPGDRGPINIPTAFDSNNAALRGAFDVTPSLTARASIDYFDNDQALQTRLSSNKQRTWNYAGSLEQAFGDDASLTLTAFGSDSRFVTLNTGGFTGVPENEAEFIQNAHQTPFTDFGGSVVWTQEFASGLLRSYSLGADYRRVSGEDIADIFLETGALDRTDVGRGKQRLWGAFAQASLVPIENLEILASVRYQEFKNYDAFDDTPGGIGAAPDSSETSVDPRISLRYEVTPDVALRAAAYTAFRAPALDNLFRSFSVPFGIFYPNPSLTPETLKGGEIGFDVTSGALRVQATAYYNEIEDLLTSRNLDFSELPPGFFFGSRNINAGSARSQGIEVEAQWEISDTLNAWANYTFADSQITENDLDPASVGQQIGGLPKNRAAIGLTYDAPFGLRVSPRVRWLEGSFADNAHTLPVDEQIVTDLSLSYEVKEDVEAYLNIENLVDVDYIADNSGFNPPLRGTPFSALVGVRLRLH